MVRSGAIGLSAPLVPHRVCAEGIETARRARRCASSSDERSLDSRNSARSAGQPFGVRNQHALALQTDPAAVGEIGQCLVHGFPGSPHQLGDLLLGQVVGDPHRAAFLRAEALGELQQLLGHPAGHVSEDEVGEIVVGAAQASGKHS